MNANIIFSEMMLPFMYKKCQGWRSINRNTSPQFSKKEKLKGILKLGREIFYVLMDFTQKKLLLFKVNVDEDKLIYLKVWWVVKCAALS